MSVEDFPLIDNETIESSIKSKDFLKVYDQQAAISNDSD